VRAPRSIARNTAAILIVMTSACTERGGPVAPSVQTPASHGADWRDALRERKREAGAAIPDSLLGWDQVFVGLQADVLGRCWSLLFLADARGRPLTQAAVDGGRFARLRTTDSGRVLELLNADTIVVIEPVGPAPERPWVLPELRASPGAPPARGGAAVRPAPPLVCEAAWERYAVASLGLTSLLHAWAERPASSWRAGITVAAVAWVSRVDALRFCLFGG